MTQDILPQQEARTSALERPFAALVRLNWETMAWAVVLLVAIVSRFYDIGVRAMSHDESLHALYSYYLYDNGNYEHNPMMHGPLLFHMNTLIYFLFGATDATARLAPALFGIGVVFMAWLMRPYLGRIGALAAGIMLTISPSLLFHSRYIRNDIFIALLTMIWAYGAFRYLDTRRTRWLLVMTLGMAFGFIAKENHFMTGTIFGLFFAGLAGWQMLNGGGWERLRTNSAADLAVLMLTLVLPFTAPFLHYLTGWESVDWNGGAANLTTTMIMQWAVLIALVTFLAFLLAYYWFGMRTQPARDGEDPFTFSVWLQMMAVFWLVEVLFFTTFLTNTRNGLASGIAGSLGYWIEQQEVQRGSQPWFYYIMLGGLYEFLPLILSAGGIATAVYAFIRRPAWEPIPVAQQTDDPVATGAEPPLLERLRHNRVYFIAFSVWWTIGSWAAYTVAGEKMPWLMTHIALPMCVLGGWWIGRLLTRIDWSAARQKGAVWLIGLTPALLFVLALMFTSAPTLGRSTEAIASITRWLLSVGLLAGLIYLAWRWGESISWAVAARLLSVGGVALLLVLTMRFSYMLTYINFDYATEYLVYAHAGPDVKRALDEIAMISERTVGGKNIVVAYDDDTSWPLSWYMREYPNSRFYGSAPNSDVMSAPVIIVGSKNYDKVRPYVERDYVKRTYRLVWWPDQGYFDFNWGDVRAFFSDPAERSRIVQIIVYRRFRDENDPSRWRDLTKWPNLHPFEMWVRRDIAAEIWDLGVTPVTENPNSITVQARDREIDLTAITAYNATYDGLNLLTPRALAVAPNGNRVIADSGNHRMVILDAAGNPLHTFGSRCNLVEGAAGGCVDPDGSGPLTLGDGQFNEPWGVTVDAAGDIYVADTWNGRIQVFDGEGNFKSKWGRFDTTNGELGDAFALFGPRGVAIDAADNLLVADTGNKRILQFTPAGELVHQMGGGGVIGGRFEEPTSIAVSPLDGTVYVADAWNRRIQKLSPTLEFLEEWPVAGWESKEIFHKPYVAVAANGDVYATDPQFFRIFVYSATGELKAAFGNYGPEMNHFALPVGIAFDPVNNGIVIADSDNARVMVFGVVP